MNEEGVEAIAMDLGLNYLYFPFSYDKSDKKDIGNAILTKGTIQHSEKLILPHAKRQNQQRICSYERLCDSQFKIKRPLPNTLMLVMLPRQTCQTRHPGRNFSCIR